MAKGRVGEPKIGIYILSSWGTKIKMIKVKWAKPHGQVKQYRMAYYLCK